MREARTGTFGVLSVLFFLSPLFGIFPRMGGTLNIEPMRIASLCLMGMRTLGAGGACLVRGWQPSVIGCVAQGTAQGLPSTDLFVALYTASVLIPQSMAICCLGAAHGYRTPHTDDEPEQRQRM